MKKSVKNIAFITGVFLLLASCSRDPNHPGLTFVPDMQYSFGYETYSTMDTWNEDTIHQMTARLPVKNTIPRGYIPKDESVNSREDYLKSYTLKNHFLDPRYHPEVNEEQRRIAGELLKNPIKLSDEVLAEGKALYTIFCEVCHGKKGDGDGSIVVLEDGSDGPFTAIPSVYKDKLPTLSDGQMFYAVTYGQGMMGGYYAQLNPEERWKVIHYIKDLAGLNDEPVNSPDLEDAHDGDESASTENEDDHTGDVSSENGDH